MNNLRNFTDIDEVLEHYRNEYDIEDGFESDNLDSNIINDSIEVLETNSHIIVGFLKHDSSPMDFWEDSDGLGELILFTNRSQADDAMKAVKKSKKLYYLTDKYEHGNVHYSIASTTGYPDQQFDVSHGCGIFIPCDEIQAQYKKMKRKEGETEAFIHFIKDSNNVLDSYSDWCNGEVYGYGVSVFNKNGVLLTEDESWGVIGHKDADLYKVETMKHTEQSYILEGLFQNVVVDEFTAADAKSLPFKIDMDGLSSYRFVHVYDKYIVAATYTQDNKAIIFSAVEGSKKVVKNAYSEQQGKRGISTSQFLQVCLTSEINQAIKDNLLKNIVQDNKPQIKI